MASKAQLDALGQAPPLIRREIGIGKNDSLLGTVIRLINVAVGCRAEWLLAVGLLASVLIQPSSARGEAVACGDDGIACFELIRRWDSDHSVFMWAYFDLIELDGTDMRREPLAQRKASLERALARATPGVRFNEHLEEEDGPLVFHYACKLGLEGIVSKRRDSPLFFRSLAALDQEQESECAGSDTGSGGRLGAMEGLSAR